MNIGFKIVFVFILGGIVFLFTTCGKQKMFKKVSYEGTVFDSIGGSPSVGILVVLKACDPNSHNDGCNSFIVGSFRTDGSGHFKIESKAARSGRYSPVVNGLPLSVFYRADESELNSRYSKIYLNHLH